MPFFDGLGGLLAAPVMAAVNADMERAAVQMVEPKDGERFLVIGFGAGVGLTSLLDAAEPQSILAVDPSEVMIRTATKRLSRHRNRDLVTLVRAGAAEIPPDVHVDAAIAVNSHQLWSPHRESVAAIAASLRPGGRLVTLTHLWAITKIMSEHRWKAQVESDLVAAGFAQPIWSDTRFRSGRAVALTARSGPTPGHQLRNATPTPPR